MGRFQRVLEILDEAVGGRDAPVGFHGAVWRGTTRAQFVTIKIFGKDLVAVGDGAASNLVLALKGQAPFGVDLAEPPPGAAVNRMPSGRDPVPAESIAVIEQWIDDGCPDDAPTPVPLTWRATNAPVASSRTDDIWFTDPQRGWAVNSNGQILRTEDGFTTWEEQFHDPEVYLRCVGFASESRGWVGTLTAGKRLFETADGGATWTAVADLPPLAPSAVCGLSVVDRSVVYASGTNYPNRPARMMRTVDGGATWQAWDMSAHAALLVDTYFTDADHGWVVGGQASVANPTRDDVRAVVLRTEDGGRTWVDRLAPLSAELPLGEWGWKIQFLDDRVGYVALESFVRGAILKTTDGGDSWTRIDINDPQGNANLEGVGFIDESTGWVGGWGSASFQDGFSSSTVDGGTTWQDANEIGRFINRFRFVGDPVTVGYSSGRTVYRYSAEPVVEPRVVAPPDGLRFLADNAPSRSAAPLQLTVTVPDSAELLTVDVWDRFGEHVRRVLDEPQPAMGPHTVDWDATDETGRSMAGGDFLLRVTVDDRSESQIVHITR
ncbi:MAG: YCF48-related protein [Pseudonocardia sp.]